MIIINFREINIGNISKGLLYRSNHPIYIGNAVENTIFQAKNAKIKTIINLSDNIHVLQSKIRNCSWYENLLINNNVVAVNIDRQFDIMEKAFMQKIKQCIIFMISHEPPYLIHCEAGIDRTGFFSILLEAFMDANFEEIVKDYMLSFVENKEYSINDRNKGSVFLRNLSSEIKGSLINPDENLKSLVVKYLNQKIGLNKHELDLLEKKLTNRDKLQYL